MASSDGTSRPLVVDIADYSDLQRARLAYAPPTPAALAAGAAPVLVASEPTTGRSASDDAALRSWFPHTAGLPMVAVVPAAAAAAAAGGVPLPAAPLRVGVVFAGRREPCRPPAARAINPRWARGPSSAAAHATARRPPLAHLLSHAHAHAHRPFRPPRRHFVDPTRLRGGVVALGRPLGRGKNPQPG